MRNQRVCPASSTDYFALSYTWGTEAATKTVLCNGEPFLVKLNLYNALEQLSMKPELKGAWIWIDAIYINQQSNSEKSVQVIKMPDVFTSAQKVLVWLETAAEDSDLAMNNIRDLAERIGPITQDSPFLADLRARQAILDRLPPDDHPVWRALIKLYQRPWFRRLWIVQKVILTKDISVLCGNRSLIWSFVEKFAERIINASPAVLFKDGEILNQPRASGFTTVGDIKFWRKNIRNNDPTHFLSMFETTREREVLNPLDRIYGLFALMPKPVRDAVVVNYELEFWEGYLKFCEWFIQYEPTLLLLSMAPSQERPAQLPFWCPNFHSPATELFSYAEQVGFKAGFHDRKSRRSTIKLSDKGNAIIVQGFRLDTVKKVAQTQYKSLRSPFAAEAIGPDGHGANNLTWEAECLQLFSEAHPTQASSPESLEMYARTLIADHFMDKKPVSPTASISAAFLGVKDFWTWLSHQVDPTTKYGLNKDASQSIARYFAAISLQSTRRFFTTENGRVGLGPSHMEPGDRICVFYSGSPLFVLRFAADGKTAKLVGDAFVHGLMDLNTMPVDMRGKDEEFIIV